MTNLPSLKARREEVLSSRRATKLCPGEPLAGGAGGSPTEGLARRARRVSESHGRDEGGSERGQRDIRRDPQQEDRLPRIHGDQVRREDAV